MSGWVNGGNAVCRADSAARQEAPSGSARTAKARTGPAVSALQGKEPPAIDPLTGTMHSRRLSEGVPLGGVGAGTFQIMTDGAISRATLNGNLDRPTDDVPGCFAAIRTVIAGRTRAQVLALHSGYSLPTAPRLDFTGLTPQARLDYRSTDLAVNVSLLAFSPLVPFVLKDSSYPVALLVFRLRNPLPVAAEVSVVLSWENLIGVGSDGRGAPRSDRTGVVAATIPSEQGYFGVRFTAPTVVSHPPAPAGAPAGSVAPAPGAADMVLMAYPQLPEATVTTASWNAASPRPAWWDGYERTGDVAGAVPPGLEGKVHPAAAVAVRLTLKPGGVADLPFVVAWYLPHTVGPGGEEIGRYYQNVFTDAADAGRRALADWDSLYALTEDWQERLTFSNLPRPIVKRLIDSVAPLTTRTLISRDGRFTLLPGPSDEQGKEAARCRLATDALLLAFFPRLAFQSLTQQAALYLKTGSLPPALGLAALGPPIATAGDETAEPRPASAPPPSAKSPAPITDSAFVLEVAEAALWTGDHDLLEKVLPAMHGVLEELLRARDSQGLPVLNGPDRTAGDITLWLAALRAGERLAERAHWQDIASSCHDAATRGATALDALAWNGRCYQMPDRAVPTSARSADCDPEQLLGQWVADQLDLGPLVSPEHLASALHAELNTSNASDATPADLTAITLSTAVLAIWQDAPTEGARRLADTTQEQSVPAAITPPSAMTPPLQDDGVGYADAAAWNAISAFAGFGYDAETAQLTLRPGIPGALRQLSSPVFAPTFWATLEYKPTVHGGMLGLRIDRLIDRGGVGFKGLNEGRSGLTLRALRVPGRPTDAGNPAENETHVSVGRKPLGFKAVREPSGSLLLTLDTPLTLTAGDRLQVEVH